MSRVLRQTPPPTPSLSDVLAGSNQVSLCVSVFVGIRHQPGSQPQNPQLLEAQRALQGNINEGLQTVQNVNQELTSR